ncbi:glycoside hydrolase superfamily [Ilyonectria robusta]|uniref:glycoside hydrolase superfamily n=1 Tax=Ilyonectria robusta TaxID=1079257 RepID=UPI001E8DC159|nr:glycoside hydrolase superfamily [Ilyonectria robusta]KAH8652915.1 glycoside hydrolase superfamily [Ilyonectria robusta]
MGELLPQKDGFDVEHVLRNATIGEKVSLLAGEDFWHTVPLPRFNVPSVRVSDGPNGVRGTKFFDAVRAACLPCGTGLAATWDQALLYEAGILIGQECKAKGAACWLGPTVCIQRSPLGGRGFESLSDDPYVTGKLAAAYIKGAQSTGVISTIKHFAANDQEHERISVNVTVSERALREVHLLPFQIAIADASPGAVMTCYNKINGQHISESKEMLTDLLRNEWGWKGLIMSDWFGTYSTAEAINAGLDLEMPGPPKQRGALVDLAISSRKVSRTTLDERARNVLEFVQRASRVDVAEEESTRDFPADRRLNRKLAADSVVLLKNEASLLPLNQKLLKSIALIGPNMKTSAFCGGGSAALQPYYTTSPYQGIVDQLPDDVEVIYEIGANSHTFLPELQAPDIRTPEGQPGIRMRFYRDAPSTQDRPVIEEIVVQESSWHLMGYSNPQLEKLFYVDIEAELIAPATGSFDFGVAAYKIKVQFVSGPSSKLVKPGVVNFGGGAGRLGMIQAVDPELAIARAVEAAKRADATVICGGLSRDYESEGFDRPLMDLPSSVSSLITAVLAAAPNTIIISQSGTPFNMLPWADHVKTHLHAWFGGNELGNGIANILFGTVNPSRKLPLLFPRRVEDILTYLNFRISLAGAETVQLYIAADTTISSIPQPVKELKGFSKVDLQPGKTRRIEIPFDRFTTAFWDQELHTWVCEAVRYRVLLGPSSDRILLEGVLEVDKTTTWSGL